mmetsp:Transcript_10892/g.21637  ORF Transcript_10892/g.21637 Transcript_10892/m.21637 type:complete len:83 (+) Transcript_10892:172-420(+)
MCPSCQVVALFVAAWPGRHVKIKHINVEKSAAQHCRIASGALGDFKPFFANTNHLEGGQENQFLRVKEGARAAHKEGCNSVV